MVRFWTTRLFTSLLGLSIAFAASGCGLRVRNLTLEEAQSIAAGVCAPDPAALLPSAERVVRSSDGASLNDSHSAWPSVSGNGRYVAFHSWSTNLLAGVTGAQSYVYDLITRELEIVSTRADGTAGNASAGDVMTAVSCEGRFSAFVSTATNLTADVVNGTTTQIFLKDRETGEIELVSKTAAGVVANGPNGVESWTASYPAISYNGRYVLFATRASNLGFAGTSWKIVRKDRETGEIELVSADEDGVAAVGTSFSPDADPTGNLILYQTTATWNGNASGYNQVYLKNMITGENRLLSRNAAGTAVNNGASLPRISGDGRYAAFMSHATDVDAGSYTHEGATNSFFRVRLSDGFIERVGPGLGGGACCGRRPGISQNGSVIAWHSNRVFSSLSAVSQVCAKNMRTGETVLVSKTADGTVANARQEILDLSPDGRWVGFQGLGTNLLPAAPYQANWQLYTLPTGFEPPATYSGERR